MKNPITTFLWGSNGLWSEENKKDRCAVDICSTACSKSVRHLPKLFKQY